MAAPPAPEALRAECRAYCRYLAGVEPSEYVQTCYERSWSAAAGNRDEASPLIDRCLLRVSRLGGLPARIADSYARLFRPFSTLRRRLILVLAILENSPPTHGFLNSAKTGTGAGIALGMLVTLLGSGLCMAAGVVLLGPLHLATLMASRAR
jgi:hypothetical protein